MLNKNIGINGDGDSKMYDNYCECFNLTRTDALNGITEHHPECDKFEYPKTWGYSVECTEIDYVFAESEEDAKSLSVECGCHCEHNDEEYGKLEVNKLTIKEMAGIKIRDDDKHPHTTTMLNEFRMSQKRRMCCSTMW
jgi:hypothetical protein